MARTNIAAQTLAGAYPVTPLTANSADVTETAADTVNQNDTALVDSKTVILARNSGASARTVTITSANDTLNRKGDITAYSLGVGKLARFGPFKTIGWSTGGRLLFEANHAEVLFAVITLP